MPAQNPLWALTDHCCRVCFGRVLERHADDGVVYRCSNCGAEAAATTRRPAVLCACGMRLKTGKDAGIRCERNPTPSPEFPSEVTASQVGEGAL